MTVFPKSNEIKNASIVCDQTLEKYFSERSNEDQAVSASSFLCQPNICMWLKSQNQLSLVFRTCFSIHACTNTQIFCEYLEWDSQLEPASAHLSEWFDFSFMFFALSGVKRIHFSMSLLSDHLPLDLSFLLSVSPHYFYPSPSTSLFGIGSSISFKAHVKGTVCCFQRPLCPAFLLLNLVSPKHFPIAGLSRPFYSQHIPLFLSTLTQIVRNRISLKTPSPKPHAICEQTCLNTWRPSGCDLGKIYLCPTQSKHSMKTKIILIQIWE